MVPEHEYAVPIGDLDAGGKSLSFPIRVAWLRGAFEGTQVAPSDRDGEVAVRVSKSGNDVVVRGTLRVDLVVPCARCLEPARVTIAEPLSALYVPRSALGRGPGDHGDGDDDASAAEADLLPYDGETVVLDDLVRDELLLAVPMIPLCSEGCPGISPHSGQPSAPASIDPRLRPLLRLKKMTMD
jgi:uncharacterized protein